MTTKYAPYTSTQAIARARSYIGRSAYTNMCQAFVVTMFGTGAVGDFDGDRAADAEDGWKAAKAKGKVVPVTGNIDTFIKNIPAGVALYWSGGSKDYGHTAISIGNGKMISTDTYNGGWGKVGIQPISYISKYWKNNLTLLGYVTTEGNGHTLTDKPKAASPAAPANPSAPAQKIDSIFRVGTYNLAMYNTRGSSTYKKRRAGVIANIKKANLDILKVQEAGSGLVLTWWTKELKKIGFNRAAGGSDGRFIFYKPTTFTYVDSGVFNLTPEYQQDDKQAAWAILTYGTNNFFFASMHLEEANGAAADKIRPKQAKNLVSQANRKTKALGIPRSRWVLSGDTNSVGAVKAQMKTHGFVASSAVAARKSNTAYATFNNWTKKLKGGQIDYIFVHSTRPVTKWTQTTSARSDHNLVIAELGQIN